MRRMIYVPLHYVHSDTDSFRYFENFIYQYRVIIADEKIGAYPPCLLFTPKRFVKPAGAFAFK